MCAACCRAHWLLAWQHKAKVCQLLLCKAGQQSSVEVDDCSAKWLHLLMMLMMMIDSPGTSLHVHLM